MELRGLGQSWCSETCTNFQFSQKLKHGPTSLVVCDLLGSTHAQKSYLYGHLDSYLKTVLQKYSHVLRPDTDSPCELSCDRVHQRTHVYGYIVELVGKEGVLGGLGTLGRDFVKESLLPS